MLSVQVIKLFSHKGRGGFVHAECTGDIALLPSWERGMGVRAQGRDTPNPLF